MYIVHKLGKMIALFPSAFRHRTNGNHLERERKKEKVMNEDDFPVYDHFSSFFFIIILFVGICSELSVDEDQQHIIPYDTQCIK